MDERRCIQIDGLTRSTQPIHNSNKSINLGRHVQPVQPVTTEERKQKALSVSPYLITKERGGGLCPRVGVEVDHRIWPASSGPWIQLYKIRSSRKIDSQRLFSREYNFRKTFSESVFREDLFLYNSSQSASAAPPVARGPRRRSPAPPSCKSRSPRAEGRGHRQTDFEGGCCLHQVDRSKPFYREFMPLTRVAIYMVCLVINALCNAFITSLSREQPLLYHL